LARENITLITKKREIIIRFESDKAEERSWLHTILDCQLSMT